MRIAIPIRSEANESAISMKFARSPWFAITDTSNGQIEYLKNPFWERKTQAGKHIFSLLTEDRRVNAFLAFELGLKVQQMAVKKKIQLIIINEKNQTLQDILELLTRK